MVFLSATHYRPVFVSAICAMVVLGFSSGVLAQAHTEANAKAEAAIKLAIESGQLELAQQLIRQEKTKSPTHVQWLFMEGVVQAQSGQLDQAIGTFKKITESHPEQSEAYNNLGVLYAAKGQLQESKDFLEKALQTHPSYQAAHRNLSDIRGQLAQQSYAKALQIKPNASVGAPQLTLLGRIGRDANAKLPPFSATAKPSMAPITAQAAPAAKAPAAALPANTTASASSKPETPNAPAATAATAAPATTAATAPVPTPASTAKPEPSASSKDQQDIETAVMRWAKAWSEADMNGYYAAYAKNFKPSGGVSLSRWKNERRDRILNKKSISVGIRKLSIQIENNTAVAKFQQIYESENIKSDSKKTLNMLRQGDDWLILRESVN